MTQKAPNGIELDTSPEEVAITVDLNVIEDTSALNAGVLCGVLAAAKVTVGVDKGAIQTVLDDVAKGNSVHARVVARAKPLVPGEPPSIDYFVHPGDIVIAGEVIAIESPGVESCPGESVFGEPINAASFDYTPLEAGENTILDADGQLISTIHGVLSSAADKLSVEPIVFVAPDKLQATMDIHAATTLGTPISFEHIADALAQSGVSYGVDQDAILAALEEAEETHEVVTQVVVAKGKEPVPPQPATLKYQFKINGESPEKYLDSINPQKTNAEGAVKPVDEAVSLVALDVVKEGSVIAKRFPASDGEDGSDVFGKPIKPLAVATRSLPVLLPGDNVEHNETTGQYTASVLLYGYPAIRDNKIVVIDPVELAEDQMSAMLTLYANYQSDNYPITTSLILKKLELLGVSYGIDTQAIESAISQVQETRQPLIKRSIATGKDGEAGSDAYLEYILNLEKKAGVTKDDGTIDYKERGTIVNVEGNQPICTKVAATLGQPAVTITGESQPSEPGKDIQFKAGQHCYFKDNIFYATEAGAVFIKDNVVHVTEVFQLNGDVDLQSGNLFQKKGCIDVGGSVQSGFEVKANGHIIVRNNIENARLIAGGDVNIGGGIVQPEGGDGYIHAVGNVTVKFSQNAQIYSYSDIIIEHSCMSSRLHAKGSVYAQKGKGNIIGGVAKAEKTIRAKSIGSPAAAVTFVEIELDPKFKKQYLEETKQLEESAKVNLEAKERLSELVKAYRERYEEARLTAEIIVEDTIYPGVKIKILGGSKKITEEIRRCRITLGTNNVIHIKPLDKKG
ncbi:hypothetical protein NBRC116494_19180 [Aurantivibrio plasticivorans]